MLRTPLIDTDAPAPLECFNPGDPDGSRTLWIPLLVWLAYALRLQDSSHGLVEESGVGTFSRP